METDRRSFFTETAPLWQRLLGLTALIAILPRCSTLRSDTAPTSTQQTTVRLQPTRIANADLKYSGYAHSRLSLVQAMRDTGLTVRPRTSGWGAGTWELSDPAPYGWIFTVQNNLFGTDAGQVTLNKDELWAAHLKLVRG